MVKVKLCAKGGSLLFSWSGLGPLRGVVGFQVIKWSIQFQGPQHPFSGVAYNNTPLSSSYSYTFFSNKTLITYLSVLQNLFCIYSRFHFIPHPFFLFSFTSTESKFILSFFCTVTLSLHVL